MERGLVLLKYAIRHLSIESALEIYQLVVEEDEFDLIYARELFNHVLEDGSISPFDKYNIVRLLDLEEDKYLDSLESEMALVAYGLSEDKEDDDEYDKIRH